MVVRQAIFPPSAQGLLQEHRYSAAIRSGDLLFVIGQVGSRQDGSPETNSDTQVRLALQDLAAVLEPGGCTVAGTVSVGASRM